MLASWFTAFIFAAGLGTWVYTKFSRTTGYGNAQSAVIGSLAVGIVAFLVFFSILKFGLHL